VNRAGVHGARGVEGERKCCPPEGLDFGSLLTGTVASGRNSSKSHHLHLRDKYGICILLFSVSITEYFRLSTLQKIEAYFGLCFWRLGSLRT
jgi:hypothetical protein